MAVRLLACYNADSSMLGSYFSGIIYGTKSPCWIAKRAAKNIYFHLSSYGALPLNTALIKNLYLTYFVSTVHAARDATQQQHNIAVRLDCEVQSDSEGNHAPRSLVSGAAPTNSG